MAKRIRKRKCRCCGVFFTPDHRNRRTQRYCSRPECRKASKAASQRRWFGKPENRDYFRGLHNVERVREWRKAHPGYFRKKADALQDDIAKTARRLQELGSDILNRLIPNTGGINDQKASHLPPAPAPGAQPVQLGGPPPGT